MPVAAGLFLLVWGLLALPWLSGAVTVPWDAKAHWQAHVQFVAAAWARGDAPWWTPHVFAGMPEIADPQSPLFAPPLALLALLDPAPSFAALDAAVLGTLAAGGLALIALFGDRGWHWAGAALAATVFAFGGSAAWRLQHVGQVMSLAWFAVALWLIERALARRAVGWGVAAGLACGVLAAGRDQVALLALYVLAGRVAWHLLARPRAAMHAAAAPLAAAGLAAALVAAVPVMLSAQFAGQSNRPAIDLAGAGAGSLHPALLLTAVAPDLYGAAGEMASYWGPPSLAWSGTGLFLAQNMGVVYFGSVTLVLLLAVGACGGLALAAEVRFFTVAGALVALYALGWYTPAFRVMYTVMPGVDLFRRPADATFLLGALVAVLAGYLLHRVVTGAAPALPPARRAAAAALVVLPFAAAAAVAAAWDRLGQAWPALAGAALSLAAAASVLAVARRIGARRPALAGAAVLAVAAADLGWANRPNGATGLPPALYDALRPGTSDATVALIRDRLAAAAAPDRRDRVEIVGLGFHWPNVALAQGFDSTLGYNPVRLADYGAAVGAGDTVATPDQRRFSPLLPSYRAPLADLLGLRLIATAVPVERIDPRLAPGDLVPVGRTADAFVYENPRALPRVMLVHRWRRADFAALIRDGGWPAVDPAAVALLERDPGLPPDATSAPAGRVRLAAYRNTVVEVAVETAAPGLVLLNDVWHPWWRATVDGAPAEILRANVLFRAVAVPAGRHTVRFAFRPLAGLAAAIAP